jgi:hypothetical protein
VSESEREEAFVLRLRAYVMAIPKDFKRVVFTQGFGQMEIFTQLDSFCD